MTEFKRTVGNVDEVERLIQAVLEGGAGAAETVTRLSVLAGDTGATVGKLGRKAAETDPAKQVYGPAMRAKVNDLVERWLSVENLARDVLQQHGASITTSQPGGPGPVPPPRPAMSQPLPTLWTAPSGSTPATPGSISASAASYGDAATATPSSASRAQAAPGLSQRERAAQAAEARLRGSGSGGGTGASAGSTNAAPGGAASSSAAAVVVDQVGSGAKLPPIPIADSMIALMRLVHLVFLRHGFQNREDGDQHMAEPHLSLHHIRYTRDDGPAILVVFMPVQRHLVLYASLEGHEEVPCHTTVQVGMAAGSVQAKADYLLAYPLLYRQCNPTLISVPPEVCFGLLTCLAIPALSAIGNTSRALSKAVFEDDLLWLRVLMALDSSPAHRSAVETTMDKQQRGEGSPGECRRLVKMLVQHARQEAEERRRREAELLARMLEDPLRGGGPRRPRVPGPGSRFPMIGGDHDVMPGGGFFPGPFGGRDPFGGGGGFGGPSW